MSPCGSRVARSRPSRTARRAAHHAPHDMRLSQCSLPFQAAVLQDDPRLRSYCFQHSPSTAHKGAVCVTIQMKNRKPRKKVSYNIQNCVQIQPARTFKVQSPFRGPMIYPSYHNTNIQYSISLSSNADRLWILDSVINPSFPIPPSPPVPHCPHAPPPLVHRLLST